MLFSEMFNCRLGHEIANERLYRLFSLRPSIFSTLYGNNKKDQPNLWNIFYCYNIECDEHHIKFNKHFCKTCQYKETSDAKNPMLPFTKFNK